MATALSAFGKEALLGVALTLLASATTFGAILFVYRCICVRRKKASNSDDVLRSIQDRNAGELEKLRHNSAGQESKPGPATPPKRDDIKQLRKHSVYTKHWLEVVSRQRLSSVGFNEAPGVELIQQNIQPELTVSNGRRLCRTSLASVDQSPRQNPDDASTAHRGGGAAAAFPPLLERSLSGDDDDDCSAAAAAAPVGDASHHGCQIQLVVSYSTSHETLTLQIVRLFGLNSLRSRGEGEGGGGGAGEGGGIRRSEQRPGTDDAPTAAGQTAAAAAAAAAAVAKTTDVVSMATDVVDRVVSSFAHSTYVGLTVLPDRDKCLITTTKRNANVIVWNESFNFGGYKADQLSSRSLQLQVFTYDQFSRSEAIGYCILSLCHVDLTTTQTIFKSLTPGTFQGDKLGELLLSLCYQPTVGRVTVVVIKARQLATKDNRQSTDPYVKIWLLINGKKVEKRKTSVKERTTNPVFNESFVFGVHGERLRLASLSFSVADRRTLGHDRVIGHVVLGTRSGPAELKHWNEAMEKARQPVAQWHRLKSL